MEEWVTLNTFYSSEKEAKRIAGIVEITESRLASSPAGLKYVVETEILQKKQGWQVRWRKVSAGYDAGCSGCGSCASVGPVKQKSEKAKVIPFKPRQSK